MPLGNRVKSDALTTVYTDEVYPVGTVFEQLADEVAASVSGVDTTVTPTLWFGERTWVFVKAAAAITAGDLCKANAIGTPYDIGRANSIADKLTIRGAANHDIASGSYGWIIAKGPCVLQAAAAVNAADLLSGTTTAGEVALIDVTAAAGNGRKVVGIALEAEDTGNPYGAGFAQAMIDVL